MTAPPPGPRRRWPLGPRSLLAPTTPAQADPVENALALVAANARADRGHYVRPDEYARVFAAHPELLDLDLYLDTWWGHP